MSQERGLNGNIAAHGRRENQQQFDDVQQSQVVPQPLHVQAMLSQNNVNQGQLQPQPQSALLDESNSSSLVYDRTIKVPKTGYTDHGSHGVAALPLLGQGNGQAGAPGVLPSSVQMQLQMQQMAAAMLQQQQLNNPSQLNNPQPQMMPPPPNNGNGGGMVGGGGTSYDPSLVGGMGLQAGQSNNVQGGRGAAAPVMNTTSSTGLMQALNAQMAANQAAMHQGAANTVVGVEAGPDGFIPLNVVDQNGNLVPNPSVFGHLSAANLDAVVARASGISTNSDAMIAPGDIRNGKKRVSPSVPLHPSQLQLHHGGTLTIPGAVPDVGIPAGFVPLADNLGIHAVAEEDESLCTVGGSSFTGALPQDCSVLPPINPVQAQQGLLGAALNDSTQQGISQTSESSQEPPRYKQQKGKGKTRTKGSNKKEERHGEVLTNPSVPSSNSGLDNAEGNLIVRRGDVLKIPRKNMHAHPPAKDAQSTAAAKAKSKGGSGEEGHVEYRVISLLGQGTFAQVFHCVDQESRKCVAVKIVKNKPAYTRQAAVEIDVFRKLNAVDGSTEGGNSKATAAGDEKSTKGGASGATSTSYSSSYSSFDDTSTATTNAAATPSKSVIRLLSYFMHHSHLCLVFEMLGPNLYELLKKRQFRGLPISAVRTLVRQATEGIKLLGKRNVVHCDLKPENILMVRGGDDGEGGSEDMEAVISECKSKGELHPGGAPGDGKSNIAATLGADQDEQHEQFIKLIDFGSACFEGQTTHTYIQSRFYRSPEVLVGLPYDSAIDIWSLGCVAAELFLGLPILPGVHEHDQLGRILEMIGPIPEWMLEKGSKSAKFFNSTPGSNPAKSSSSHSFGPSAIYNDSSDASPSSPTTWEFKSRQEYIAHLTSEEKRSKGGAAKLEQQQTNRYFKKRKLEDIVMHHGVCNTKKEREQLGLFVHFLKGVLDPDPWKRWTAHQASMHPFLTGSTVYRRKATSGDGAAVDGKAKPYDIQWQPPWDASISKRKLLVIQKTQEKAAAAAQQQAAANATSARRRRSLNESALRSTISQSVPETGVAVHPNNMMMPPLSTAQAPLLDIYGSPLKGAANMPNLQIQPQIQPSPSAMSVTSQMAAMADAMSLERARSNISMGGRASPPQVLAAGGGGGQGMYPTHPAMLSASVGGAGVPFSPYNLNLAGRSLSEHLMHPAEQQLMAAAAQQQQLQALANDAAFLQPPPPLPPPPTLMGAQSFSGAYYQPGLPSGSHYPYVESDLGYALQRPGVFPAGMIGGDGGGAQFMSTPLQRQSSNSMMGQAMLSASLSNLSSSTPQNYGAAPGPMMNYQPTGVAAMSPGGLLLQQLGLQEQMMIQSNAAGTSLLSQQLEEFTQTNPQQQPMTHVVQNPNPQMIPASTSAGMLNTGSYLGGPVSASLPQNMQNASFTDVGNYIQQQMQVAGSFPPPEAVYPNAGVSQQQNMPPGQPNRRTTMH